MKPLIKWAGGKRWLVPILESLWAPYQRASQTFVEPFAGGLAISLGLNPRKALLNDINNHLINFYQQVQQGLIIQAGLKNNSKFYYAMRKRFNNLIQDNKHRTSEAAGIFYYLIKTGFNGLCRFNSLGEFNVPFGQHKRILYRSDFLEYQSILAAWKFSTVDFEDLKLRGDEFLYVDPPYDVEFTQYHTKGFSWEDQQRLGRWLAKHQGSAIISNQATPRILELYQDLKFKVFTLPAPRSIACNGDRRPALEMLAVKGLDEKKILQLKTINHIPRLP